MERRRRDDDLPKPPPLQSLRNVLLRGIARPKQSWSPLKEEKASLKAPPLTTAKGRGPSVAHENRIIGFRINQTELHPLNLESKLDLVAIEDRKQATKKATMFANLLDAAVAPKRTRSRVVDQPSHESAPYTIVVSSSIVSVDDPADALDLSIETSLQDTGATLNNKGRKHRLSSLIRPSCGDDNNTSTRSPSLLARIGKLSPSPRKPQQERIERKRSTLITLFHPKQARSEQPPLHRYHVKKNGIEVLPFFSDNAQRKRLSARTLAECWLV
jgi:hypothetical protein